MADLTSRQAAAILGVALTTVQRWANNGKLACTKTAGGYRRFKLEDFERFKAERERLKELEPDDNSVTIELPLQRDKLQPFLDALGARLVDVWFNENNILKLRFQKPFHFQQPFDVTIQYDPADVEQLRQSFDDMVVAQTGEFLICENEQPEQWQEEGF